jgi:DNA-binding NarL/FixJ family response regulator
MITAHESLAMKNFTDAKSKKKASILIVEDHNELRSSLSDWLQSIFQDCSFMTSRTGEEAIDLASTYQPDIVLMDIQLPQMNGIEAMRRIKKISPQTQAVILSVHNYSAYIEEAAAAGACAYINKHDMHMELIPILVKLLPISMVADLKL